MNTGRFTPHAAAYAAGRPGYPPEALAALFAGFRAPAQTVVADLGAGTGISARALAATGARVFAVEPNAAMRAAAAGDPGVTWVAGTAEATTLPAASVDLAVALQAWHWFDTAAALREARRILRPGGRTAVVYYERDESDAATAAFGAIVRRFAVDDTEGRRARALEGFCALPGAVRAEFANEQSLDRSAFEARVASSSYLPLDGVAGTRLREAMAGFFTARARGGTVTLHLVTTVAHAP